MDETDLETEDQTADADLSAFPDLNPRDPASFMRVYSRSMQEADAAARTESEARRQAYEQARAQLEGSRFGAPSQSEMLLRLSQALLSPTKMSGFKGTLANVAPVLADAATERRQADEARAASLMKLQQQYRAEGASTASQAAQQRLAALKGLAPLFKQQTPSMGQWSETLMRYIPKDRPVVVKSGVLNGKRVESLSDGNMRVYNSDGTSSLYDAGGNLIPTGGQ